MQVHTQWSSPIPWIPIADNKEGVCKPKRKRVFGDERYFFCLLACGKPPTAEKDEENCSVPTVKCFTWRSQDDPTSADMNGSRKTCVRFGCRPTKILGFLQSTALSVLDQKPSVLIREQATTKKWPSHVVRLWVPKQNGKEVSWQESISQ